MLEKTVEAYLVERVRALGGTAYKFTSPARASVPDRIVILPPGRIFFVELKRPGGKLTRGQEREHEHLRRLGTDVRMLDSIGAINAFLNAVQAVAADGASADEPTAWMRVTDITEWTDTEPETDGWTPPYRERAAVSPATASGLPAWFDTFLTNVCEIPDRSSPEGEPDAIIATLEELKNCALNAIEEGAGDEPATADERAAFETKTHQRLKQLVGDEAASMVTFGDGYDSDYVSAAWIGWQAGRASQAAAPAEAREPVATFDDGLKVYLDSWTGGRHEAGSFGEVTLRFTDERHTNVRDYRAKDIAPADAGEAVASEDAIRNWMGDYDVVLRNEAYSALLSLVGAQGGKGGEA
ncbi:VRR-NUC domain-containing protein [Burkholderia gladioli]|uniref:VRR-NUC domain-containing protein n=1 Tax=Burkholderia gladioli TaxID=28095 RepID=UPI001ABBA59C|nr:VRR-NUC domain-containing protein [Burkholderia gladioli]